MIASRRCRGRSGSLVVLPPYSDTGTLSLYSDIGDDDNDEGDNDSTCIELPGGE